MGVRGIGGRADANGSGSSADPVTQTDKPKPGPKTTQSGQAGSAKAGGTTPANQATPAGATAPTKTGAGIAANTGGTLPPAEPNSALVAGAQKGWIDASLGVPACNQGDIKPMIPVLNEIARGAANSDKAAIKGAVRQAGDQSPDNSYLAGIHDPRAVTRTGDCVAGLFKRQEPGEALVRKAIDNDQLDRVVHEVLALGAAIAMTGGLKHAPNDLAELGAAIKAQGDRTKLEDIARGVVLADKARDIVIHAAEWVLMGPGPTSERPSKSERLHRLAQLVSKLINDAAPDEKLDRNLLATIVIVCAKGMGDVYVERLQGILEGIIKPSNEEIDKWPALVDEWFAPVIRWIHETIRREEQEEENNLITIIHAAEPVRSPWTPWINPDAKKAKPLEPKKENPANSGPPDI